MKNGHDLAIRLISYAAMYVPIQLSGAAIVVFVTLGSGLTYLADFGYTVSHAVRTAGASVRPLGRVALVGNLINFAASAALTGVLCFLLAKWGDRGSVLWGSILGFSALWAVFLVINYLTSPSRRKP